MRKFLLTATLVSGLSLFGLSVRAEDKKAEGGDHVTGVLIDNNCGAKSLKKDNAEEDAAKHPKACALKCADSGFMVISGTKSMKLDDNGNKLAKEYLEAEGHETKVVIHGTPSEDGMTIAVTKIEAAGDEAKKSS